jgi:hypothetical protein
MKAKLAKQLVAEFWEQVGYHEPFPRTLERAIMSTTPVFVVKVHHCRLDTRYVQDWLRDRNVSLPAPWKQRTLNGCLVAYRGEAAIFLDGTLSADEARVTIAHEFGHFLAEYEWPRMRAWRRLGESVVEILDGDRLPTPNERIAATLADVQLGVYVHYMDRTNDLAGRALVSRVERTADIVAAELVAPQHAVVAKMNENAVLNYASVTALLCGHFGLPALYAEWYAKRLLEQAKPTKSFSQVLGF